MRFNVLAAFGPPEARAECSSARAATNLGRIPEDPGIDLRADLSFLASDALQGRMSLQPGDDAAAQWIASEFTKAGLSPAMQRQLFSERSAD